jgi:hypothetical protein
MLKEKERKEQELRALAQKARMERSGTPPPSVSVPNGGGRERERERVDDGDADMDMEHPRAREQHRETREEIGLWSFKPDKAFSGVSERPGKRDRPVEFDKQEENDPFGLDQFLTEVKKGKKAVGRIRWGVWKVSH